MTRLPLRLALAGTSFLALSTSAFALDGQDFLAKLNKNFASGGSVTATDVSVDGSDVSMKGLTVKPAGAEAKPMVLGDVTFSTVEEDEDGNYTVEEVKFPDVNTVEKDTSFSAKDLKLSGLFIAADPSQTSIDSLAPFESASVGEIVVTEKGKQVFSLASVEATATVREDESGVDYSWDATGLKADLANAPDPETKDAVEKLGLQTLEGGISIKSSWELAKGTAAIEALTLDFKDVGKLDVAVSFSGLTLDLLKKLEETSKQMNDPQTKDAAGLQLMGFMQQLTFDSARIRFDDASITKRALDYAGQKQGIDGAQLAQSLKAMVPLMIGQLNMPDLQNAISTAVSTYLDDPKSMTVTAAPASPVAFPMIMGAAMGAPNTLPQVLGVKVTAND